MALSIGPGEAETIGTGETTYADSVALEGTLNLAGTLNATATADATATPSAGSDFTATGDAIAAASVGVDGGAALAAASNVSDELPTIRAGRFHRTRAGETEFSPEINLSGELHLEGTINLTDTVPAATALDAGVALTVNGRPIRREDRVGFAGGAAVTVPTIPSRFGTATATAGAALPVARSIQFQTVTADAGAAVDATATPTVFPTLDAAAGAALSSTGTAFAEQGSVTFGAGVDAAGVPTLVRTGASATFTAGGALDADGGPVALFSVLANAGATLDVTGVRVIPARRRDDATLVYDDRDEFDLGLDS